jgi:RNA polymerase sigma-70 factor, ECF subfamily
MTAQTITAVAGTNKSGTGAASVVSIVPTANLTRADFERLVLKHRDSLVVWARRLTNSSEDAQDLTQETLLRAFDRFHTFHGDANAIPGWLRTILRNQFINQWRRHKNDPAIVSDEACAEAALLGPSPETITLHRAEASALLAAVAALPPMYRHPLTLADMDGLSYQEISERLRLPLNTVRSRIHRARQKVQRSLAPWRVSNITLQ